MTYVTVSTAYLEEPQWIVPIFSNTSYFSDSAILVSNIRYYFDWNTG